MPWILDNGLHCRSSGARDPNFVSIGNPDLIEKRMNRRVPCGPGGVLEDYIPFYFTPFTPMMYNIKTGRSVSRRDLSEIVILLSSLRHLDKTNVEFVFSDRHAYLEMAEFFADLNELQKIDWPKLRARNFRRRPDDPEAFDRYQAEALVHRHLSLDNILGLACRDNKTMGALNAEVRTRNLELKVVLRPGWYV